MNDEYRLFRPTYTSGGERRTSPTWNIAFTDHQGRRQSLAGYTEERQTTAMAEKLCELIQLRRQCVPAPEKLSRWIDKLPQRVRDRLANMDLIDATAIASDRPLIEHLDGRKDAAGVIVEPGYCQAMAARGNTDKHVNMTRHRVRTILDNCGFTFWRELAAPGAATRVEVWLGGRRTKGEIGGATFNYFIRDFRGFCRWLHEQGRAPGLALRTLKRVKNADMDTDRRRALSVEEMRHLIDAATGGKSRCGLTGDERAILYRFAFETGIRPGQIRSMTVADFNLDADPPTVTTQARFVKRRRIHVQQLRPAMAVELRRRFASKLPAAAAFNLPSKYHMAEMLRADLLDARTAWIEDAPEGKARDERRKSDFLAAENNAKERAVFYSTRHAHGTALAAAGVPEKDIAASMHHASRTTTTRYLHSDGAALSSAIGRLPDMDEPTRQIATGTVGLLGPAANPLRIPCATGASKVQSGGVNADFGADGKIAGSVDSSDVSGILEGNSGNSPRGGIGRRYGLKIR